MGSPIIHRSTQRFLTCMSASFHNIAIAGGDTAQPVTMRKRLHAMAPFLQSRTGRFLDCGCGSGAYVAAIGEEFGLDVQGIEYERHKVEAAWKVPSLRDRVRQGDLQALGEADATWDFALLNEVLEHVPDDRTALQEVARVLKVGGILFIFSPNRCFPFETHGVYWKRSGRPVPHWMPFVPYVPLVAGRGIFRYWARNYWPGELARLARAAGFTVINRSYIGLTFENISGRQPALIRFAQPVLRGVSDALEHCPGLRCLSVTQVLICRK